MKLSNSSDQPADVWIRPGVHQVEPMWGHRDGLRIGLSPLPGPRGLLRVYAPYLGHPSGRMINYIAVEPVPEGATSRGFSELEPSSLDDARGKRMWGCDDPHDAAVRKPFESSAGVIEFVDGVSTLTVYIGCERFDNGADVFVRVRFRADRPHEVAVAGFARATSVPLGSLILTATMGNWARLRVLHLRERDVSPQQLWPGFDKSDFTEHARFGLDELVRDGKAAVVTAESDEKNPAGADYADDTVVHWHYVGEPARQGWRIDDPHPEAAVLVNGRASYWASTSPIGGGTSYENFEVVEPFRDGAEYRFFVEPLDKLGN